MKTFQELKEAIKNNIPLVWNDPDFINGNDYTITYIEDLNYIDEDDNDEAEDKAAVLTIVSYKDEVEEAGEEDAEEEDETTDGMAVTPKGSCCCCGFTPIPIPTPIGSDSGCAPNVVGCTPTATPRAKASACHTHAAA